MSHRVEIHYCPRCRWLPRATWMAQELLTTFEEEIGELALVPGAAGTFDVVADGETIYSRAKEGGFPELKTLKQLLRDRIAPARSLGHSDTGEGKARSSREAGPDDPEEILEFWFGSDLSSDEAVAARNALWFQGDPGFDAEVARRFGDLPERIRAGELASWERAPRPALALVLALDQFPRNLYRGQARAFAYDDLARAVARRAVERGFDHELHPVETGFLYLPFEHAEDREAQARCEELFLALLERCGAAARENVGQSLDYARRHRAVIERFGRFPHRNAALGRASTAEERAYLEAGGDRF